MDIAIRRADAGDFTVIRQVAHATWPHTFAEILSPAQIAYMLEWMYSPAALAEQAGPLGHVFLIAEQDGCAVGYVSYQFDHPEAGTTKIHKLYLLPALQGRGIGRRLVDAVREAAQSAGQSALQLNVNRYNKAIEFYERYGFLRVGIENIDIGNGFLMEDAVMRMSLSLPLRRRT